MSRHPNILDRERSALLIVDMQEKFMPAIADYAHIEKNIVTLARGCRILNVPLFYTEQYPKGLGRTTEHLAAELHELQPFEKLRFSAAGEHSLIDALKEKNISQLVLTGIETHVCVLQSALDFLHLGYVVHVIQDGTGSRKTSDRESALRRMQQNGITVSNLESALFELTVTSGTNEFKQISKLIK
jgi:nicotinamidase-related amidase